MTDRDDLEIRRHLQSFIPQRMAEMGYSKSDLARMTDSDPSKITRLLQGLNTPSLSFARRLCRALNCTLDDLAHNSQELTNSARI